MITFISILLAPLLGRMARKSKLQADKANKAQVELHIDRQRYLGERMIGDNDQPSRWDLLATLAVLMLLFVGTLKGWW